MLKPSLIVVMIASLLAGGYYWLASSANGSPDAPRYQTTTVKRGPLIQTVATDGRVEPNFVVEVKSKASGEIVRLVHEEGAQVKKGDLLVELDPSDEERQVRKMASNLAAARAKQAKAQSELATARLTIPAAIAEATAGVASAKAALLDVQNKLRRAQGLDQRQIISREVLETAETTYEKALAEHQQALAALQGSTASRGILEERQHDIALAQTQVADAEIALEEAQERLADTRITAPIDGIILLQLVEQGQIISSGISTVSGGTPLLHVADLSKVFVVASVDETDIGQVQVGHATRLTADAYRERNFQGTVVHLAPQGMVESNVTTFAVKIAVEGEGKAMLKPGMSVNVEIVTGQRENTVQVVSTAILERRGAAKTVFQLDNGNPVPVPVQIGFSDGVNTEILQGVQPGAEVVANVAILRREGAQAPRNSQTEQDRTRNMSRFMRRLQGR